MVRLQRQISSFAAPCVHQVRLLLDQIDHVLSIGIGFRVELGWNDLQNWWFFIFLSKMSISTKSYGFSKNFLAQNDQWRKLHKMIFDFTLFDTFVTSKFLKNWFSKKYSTKFNFKVRFREIGSNRELTLTFLLSNRPRAFDWNWSQGWNGLKRPSKLMIFDFFCRKCRFHQKVMVFRKFFWLKMISDENYTKWYLTLRCSIIILEDRILHWIEPNYDQLHGWVVRGDLKDPQVKIDVDDAIMRALEFALEHKDL